LHAHDFWIEPSTFRPRAGERVFVGLRVGELFAGDAVPRDNARIEAFYAKSGGRKFDVGGIHGRDPAGAFIAPSAAPMIVAFDNKPAEVDLDPVKADAYLKMEGIDHLVRGKKKDRWRELYSRCVKSLLNGTHDERLGLRLELVIGDGGVQLFFDNKPLANALVVAMHQDAPQIAQHVRTDAKGRAKLDTSKRGVWLIKAVHMIPAPRTSKADWESFWASVTFER
jgi:hypothetical protein